MKRKKGKETIYQLDRTISTIEMTQEEFTHLLGWRDDHTYEVRHAIPEFEDIYILIRSENDHVRTYFRVTTDMKHFVLGETPTHVEIAMMTWSKHYNKPVLVKVADLDFPMGVPVAEDDVKVHQIDQALIDLSVNYIDAIQTIMTTPASTFAWYRWQLDHPMPAANAAQVEAIRQKKPIPHMTSKSPRIDRERRIGRKTQVVRAGLHREGYTRHKTAWDREGHWRHYRNKDGSLRKRVWIATQTCHAKSASEEAKEKIGMTYRLIF